MTPSLHALTDTNCPASHVMYVGVLLAIRTRITNNSGSRNAVDFPRFVPLNVLCGALPWHCTGIYMRDFLFSLNRFRPALSGRPEILVLGAVHQKVFVAL